MSARHVRFASRRHCFGLPRHAASAFATQRERGSRHSLRRGVHFVVLATPVAAASTSTATTTGKRKLGIGHAYQLHSGAAKAFSAPSSASIVEKRRPGG